MFYKKKLNLTEKKYGYLYWSINLDNEIKETLKNNLKIKNHILIDVKIGNVKFSSRNMDLIRRRIFMGSALKNIDCDIVSIRITPEIIKVKCKKNKNNQ